MAVTPVSTEISPIPKSTQSKSIKTNTGAVNIDKHGEFSFLEKNLLVEYSVLLEDFFLLPNLSNSPRTSGKKISSNKTTNLR
jgi:hypothetical protein